MTDNRNTILAVILSGLVLIAWQYFYNVPQMEKQRAQTQAQAELQKPAPQTAPDDHAGRPRRRPASAAPSATAPADQPGAAQPVVSRDAAIAARPRVKIDTPRLSGSISLKGARIDDLSLVKYRETVDPEIARDRAVLAVGHRATPITPSSAGCRRPARPRRCPTTNTVWQQEGSGSLTPTSPVTLKYDNGEGLTFRRTIAIDDRYLFTIKDEVTNVGTAPVTLYPFALISRHGTPRGLRLLHPA